MGLEDYCDGLEARPGGILRALGSQPSPEESREVGRFLEIRLHEKVVGPRIRTPTMRGI